MNHQIIPVFTGDNNTQLCNARDLHAYLESGREFATWIKNRIEEYGFVESEDYLTNLSNRSGGSAGKKRTDYHLTLDMAKELAMVENNDKGRAVRRYFIRAEKQLRHTQQVQQNRMIEELRDMARHMLPLPGVKRRARDGVLLSGTVVLIEQSRKALAELVTSTHPGQQRQLHIMLRYINDALGIPTETLEEIFGAPNDPITGKGE